MAKTQLHVSHLATWLKCGMQYYFRYIKGKIVPPGISIVIGQATHDAIASNYNRKKATKRLLPEEELCDVARTAIGHKLTRALTLTDEERKTGLRKVKGAAVDTTVNLSLVHHQAIAWTVTPVAVERDWNLEIDGFPYDLAGWIDVVAKEGKRIKIRDNKTSGKRKQQAEVNSSLQLTAYSYATKVVRDLNYYPDVGLDVLVHTKTTEYEQVLKSRRFDSDRDYLFAYMEKFAIAIEKGIFVPCDPTFWACSSKWCGYWNDVCPYGRRGRKSIAITS